MVPETLGLFVYCHSFMKIPITVFPECCNVACIVTNKIVLSLSSIILRWWWCRHESSLRSSVSCTFHCLLYASVLFCNVFFGARHPCFRLSTLTSYDSVTLSAVIVLPPFLSHARTMWVVASFLSSDKTNLQTKLHDTSIANAVTKTAPRLLLSRRDA